MAASFCPFFRNSLSICSELFFFYNVKKENYQRCFTDENRRIRSMKSFWKKLLAQAICVSMCLPVLQGMEVNATEKNNIEVVYSSYNDLEMEYALEDMTSEKNLVFQAQTQGTSEASVDINVYTRRVNGEQ
jgi:hypothetical protein